MACGDGHSEGAALVLVIQPPSGLAFGRGQVILDLDVGVFAGQEVIGMDAARAKHRGGAAVKLLERRVSALSALARLEDDPDNAGCLHGMKVHWRITVEDVDYV